MSGSEERFQQAMNQGHSAAWDQMWDRAAAYYRQALDEFPNHPKALTSLGLALFELQDFKEALVIYQNAASVLPDDPLPLEKAAEASERLGDLQQAAGVFLKAAELYARNRDMNKAIETWTRVTRLNPEHLLAHSRLALVFERMGRKQQAVAEYLAITSLLQNSGDVAKAIQTATHALQVNPASNEVAKALQMLKTGQLLPKPSRPRGATGPLLMAQVRQLEKSKQQANDKPGLNPIEAARQRALTDLASMLFEEENQEAQATKRGLQAIMSQTTGMLTHPVDSSRIILHLSQLVDQQARGDSNGAIEQLEGAMAAGLDHVAGDFDLGLMLFEVGRLESAIRHLQRAVKHMDFALAARLLLGQIYVKMNRVKDAAVEYLEALKMADAEVVPPEHAEELRQLYEPLVEAQAQQTDVAVQQRVCENVSEMLLRADWQEHLTRARQQLPTQGEDGPPIPLAEILTQTKGSRMVEAITKIHQYARAGNRQAAMEEAFYALTYAPTYLPLHTYIGELLLQSNMPQKAVNKFYVIAQTYSSRGEPARAIETFRKIIELAPMDMSARTRLIDSLIALGRNDDAILEYLNLADVYYNLADLIMARKTYTQALRLAQQANAETQWKVKILHRMADIDLQSLDWRQALRVYEQIRTLQPDDKKARNSLVDLNLRLSQSNQAMAELDNYIQFLLSHGKKEEAAKFVAAIVEEHEQQPGIRRRLAELYRQTGNVEAAIKELDIAGDLLLDAGDRKGAIETVMAILALKPPNVADYQKALAALKEE